MELKVNLGDNSYPIYIRAGLLQEADQRISEVFRGKRIMIISDDNVFPIYGSELESILGKNYECSHYILPHGELSKSFDVLPPIYGALLEHHITRSDLVIALGGGVIGDLTGFVAATFLRGVPVVQIPTSLLAQVDSSVGGKVAVDLPQGKNLVGTFYHPKMVLIDPNVLDSLNTRYINDGMGEVIKYGCIKSEKLFHLLDQHGSFKSLKRDITQVIYECVDCKRVLVEEDQFDYGNRMMLNFGHTLAHTIEQHFHYERESHGEAVAIGMYQITRIAEGKGLTERGTAQKIRQILMAYGLPESCGVPSNELLTAIELDKKNIQNHLNVVLLNRIGDSYLYKTNKDFFMGTGIL